MSAKKKPAKNRDAYVASWPSGEIVLIVEGKAPLQFTSLNFDQVIVR